MSISRRGLLQAIGFTFGAAAVAKVVPEVEAAPGRGVRYAPPDSLSFSKGIVVPFNCVPTLRIGDVTQVGTSGLVQPSDISVNNTILGICVAREGERAIVLTHGLLEGFNNELVAGDRGWAAAGGEITGTRSMKYGVYTHIVGQSVTSNSFFLQPVCLGRLHG